MPNADALYSILAVIQGCNIFLLKSSKGNVLDKVCLINVSINSTVLTFINKLLYFGNILIIQNVVIVYNNKKPTNCIADGVVVV